MKSGRSFYIVPLLVLALSSGKTRCDFALANDAANGSDKDSRSNQSDTSTDLPNLKAATPRADKSQVLPPLQGYAKRDARGTPVVPEWKMQAGYDEMLGKFYVGMFGHDLFPINGPPAAAILGAPQLKNWKGHKPHPCLLKFTKLQDASGGYYFQSLGSDDGPRGWIIPEPAEPHKTKQWAIYFMQEPDAKNEPKASPPSN